MNASSSLPCWPHPHLTHPTPLPVLLQTRHPTGLCGTPPAWTAAAHVCVNVLPCVTAFCYHSPWAPDHFIPAQVHTSHCSRAHPALPSTSLHPPLLRRPGAPHWTTSTLACLDWQNSWRQADSSHPHAPAAPSPTTRLLRPGTTTGTLPCTAPQDTWAPTGLGRLLPLLLPLLLAPLWRHLWEGAASRAGAQEWHRLVVGVRGLVGHGRRRSAGAAACAAAGTQALARWAAVKLPISMHACMQVLRVLTT
jgi:hypothetical protein